MAPSSLSSLAPMSPEDRFQELLAKLAEHYPNDDPGIVHCAYGLLQADRLQRNDAAGFTIQDALGTATVLAKMRIDPPAIAAALIVRLARPAAETSEQFGVEVAKLVEGVARLDRMRWDRIDQESGETLRKMFIAIAADIRVVVIALAIRVQRMRALRDADGSTEDEAEAKRVARESLEVFAPLANRLGIWQFKWELEDLSLRELEPEAFAELRQKLHETRELRDAYIERAIELLKAKLSESGIKAQVSGRAKHIYSIYKKMRKKNLDFEQVYDASAVRVITQQVSDCYGALGLVHSIWVPMPGEFDDYIARPKDNLYQSLHTAVIGPEGKPLEVQIRTGEMQQYAEFGVAAHWAYKEGVRPDRAVNKKFMVLRQLMDWERELADPHQFVESLKTDVFKDQVYVFTPAGDIIDLPLGATPLDFAYRIHTQVGHRCRGAKVNDQIVPLDHQLKTGDRIEILTQKQAQPSRDWLNSSFGYLRTNNARAKVRAWFRAQGRDLAVEQGRDIVEHDLHRMGLEHVTVQEIARELEYESLEDLYAAVGFGDRSPQAVGSAALRLERQKAPPEEPEVPSSVPLHQKRRIPTGISFGGVDDILGKPARCCNPVPGDPVVGFISRGRGLTIHRRDCKHLAASAEHERERLVEVDWGAGEGETFLVDVLIRAQDRPGLLRDVSALVAQSGVIMTAARADASPRDGSASLRLSLEFASADEVAKLLGKLGLFSGVTEVRRVAR